MHHRRTLLTALALHLLTSGVAQVTFQRRYALPSDWGFSRASVAPDGGLVVAGNVRVNQGVDYAGSLVRLDPAGNMMWLREYQAFGPDLMGYTTPYCRNAFNDVHVLNNDLIVVAGSGYLCNPNWQPPYMAHALYMAVDGAGNMRWAEVTEHGTYETNATRLAAAPGAQVLVASNYTEIGGQKGQVQSFLIDTTGCTPQSGISIRENPPQSYYGTWIYDIERGADAKLRVCSSSGPILQTTITKLNAAFTVEWTKSWSDLYPKWVGSWASGGTCAASDSTLIALTTNGTFDWGLKLNMAGGRFRDLAVRPTGEILLLGYTTGSDPCSWVMQLDNLGNLQWIERYGDNADPLSLKQLILMADGGLRLLGSDAAGQLVVIATDASGSVGTCTSPAITAGFMPYTPIPTSNVLIYGPADDPEPRPMLSAPLYGNALPLTCTSSPLNLQASGRVFVDNDQDGAYGTGDAPVPFNAVQVSPNAGTVFCDPDGSYLYLPPTAGIRTLTPVQLPGWWTVTTDSASYTVDLNAVTPTADSLDFGLGTALDTTVVQAGLVSPPFGCLSPVGPWASVQNLGTTTPELHITFTFDTLLTLSSTVPPADSVVGNVVHWHVDSLAHFGSLMLSPIYNAPSFMNMGDTVHLYLEVHAVDSLGNLVLLAADTVTDVITCAYDPNDKQVEPLGDGPDGFIGPTTDWLTYTVRFQNTGNDTAQTVVIEDLLSQHLQWGTLQILGASHPLTGVSVNPYGLAAFRFDGIMLPDSGANGPASQGFVRFRSRMKNDLTHRTRIENSAGIHFDLNPAVVTNTVLNTVFDCSSIPWQAQIVEYAGYFGADPTLEPSGPMYTYQWYLNGTPIPGTNGFVPYYTPTQNGHYTVLITDEDGCTSMSPAASFIITSEPEQELKEASLATVVPNPFGEATEVRFLQHVPAGTPLTLVDAHGRVVRSMRSDGSSVLELPRSDLAPGLYVLRIGELGAVRLAVE